MEPIAKNHTVITKKLFYEAMAAADNYRASALKGMAMLAGAWAILLIFTLLLDGSMIMALVELGILALIGVWLVYMLPRGKYKKAYSVFCSRSGGNPERTTLFYEDHCVTDGTAVFYEEIDTMKETKHLLVLKSRDKTGLILSLDGFTQGDCKTATEQINQYREETK